MMTPYLIRGTPEWDNREFFRYTEGCRVLSFGAITPEMRDDPMNHNYVRQRIYTHLTDRGVPEEKAAEAARLRNK